MSWCWDEPLEQRSLPGFQHPPPNSHQNTWGRVCMHHKDLVTQATKWFVLHVVWLHHKSKEFQAWSECPTLEDCGIFFKLSTLKDTPSVSLGCSHENWQKQLGIELKKKKTAREREREWERDVSLQSGVVVFRRQKGVRGVGFWSFFKRSKSTSDRVHWHFAKNFLPVD